MENDCKLLCIPKLTHQEPFPTLAEEILCGSRVGEGMKIISEDKIKMASETLAYSSYVIRETRKSAVDPEATITEDIAMKCPRCKKTLLVMDHGQKQKCGGCKLEMQLYGNGLECFY